MPHLNATHHPALRSWVHTANDPACDFPIQNLPYGIFSDASDPRPRVCMAIGDQVLDLARLEQTGLLNAAGAARVFNAPALNPFMELGPVIWSQTRARLSHLLNHDVGILRDNASLCTAALVPMREAIMHMPFKVAGFTDFYASREHATNVGLIFRDPKNALLPNWLHIPIGYNGRANTVVVSGTDVHRPVGQIKLPDQEIPILAPSRKLDFELEVGAIVGQSSRMGERLSVAQAQEMIFGFVLLNDWSARDIQQWEYVPLGPFQSKVFATSISPWVVTREALEPFRVQGPRQVPMPLPYLRQSAPHNYDIGLQVDFRPGGADATPVCRTNFKGMYWSSAQQLAHHSLSGCAMQTGDLLGSGTISGPDKGSFGSLL